MAVEPWFINMMETSGRGRGATTSVLMVPVCVAVVVIKVRRAHAKPTGGRDPVAQAFAMCLNGTMSRAERAVLAAYFRRVSDDVDEMRRRWQARWCLCRPSAAPTLARVTRPIGMSSRSNSNFKNCC